MWLVSVVLRLWSRRYRSTEEWSWCNASGLWGSESCPGRGPRATVVGIRRWSNVWGDGAFDADLVTDVIGNLLVAPALDAGDIKQRKPAIGPGGP